MLICYSCIGRVVSLRGDAVPCTVTVRARGQQSSQCDNTEESTQAEPNGHFRVRGLKVNLT